MAKPVTLQTVVYANELPLQRNVGREEGGNRGERRKEAGIKEDGGGGGRGEREGGREKEKGGGGKGEGGETDRKRKRRNSSHL